ncbi:hypothetical protein GIB67_028318, partial [Kingdonia uniflora]
ENIKYSFESIYLSFALPLIQKTLKLVISISRLQKSRFLARHFSSSTRRSCDF